MNPEWIKISERKPTIEEYPIAVYSPNRPLDGDDNNDGIYFRVRGQPIYPDVTHWMSAKLPAPPPKEKTQKELDAEACFDWSSSQNTHFTTTDVWIAALAWERKEVGAMLGGWRTGNSGYCAEALAKIQKRCGL